MGCVIDLTARTFSSNRSGFVAAVIPSQNNANFSEAAQGITATVERSGLHLLLGCSDDRAETEAQRVRTLLRAAGIAVVEAWDLSADAIEHTAGFSNAAATAALVHHLHGKGYRQIGFIGGTSRRASRCADRRRGSTEAIAALGLPAGRLILFGQPPISMAHGAQAVRQRVRQLVRQLVVQQWPDGAAVVCASDLCAFGALKSCQRLG